MSKSKRKAAFKLLRRGSSIPDCTARLSILSIHGWGEDMLYVHVRFMDKTEVCWRWLLI